MKALVETARVRALMWQLRKVCVEECPPEEGPGAVVAALALTLGTLLAVFHEDDKPKVYKSACGIIELAMKGGDSAVTRL